MIDVSGLHKHYGDVHAVADVSFNAADRAITALLGPNGAGKSTTLRMLSTVIAPSSGEARVDGFEVRQEPLEVRRRIGILPHRPGIYRRLTALENINYFGRLHGLSKVAINERTDELIDMLDMSEFAHRRAAGFSQGQQVKVALARALVHSPANIILDEPTNGLDVMATRALRDIIRSLRDSGVCVLFSSHIMQEVANLCDHMVIIDHGRIAFDGSPDALTEITGEPDLENAFVAILSSQTPS